MLNTAPVLMWSHKGTCLRMCSMLSTLFPKVLATTILTWAEYSTIVAIHASYPSSGYGLIVMFLVSALYLLSLYTYHKVIAVGAGSPADFSLLRLPEKRNPTPYDSLDSDSTKSSPLNSPSGSADSVVPPHWLLTSHHIENNATAYRSCTTCSAWKPDRCHHCSVCRRCFLRMDHHCPWFACCIGFRNHKFFIQSLIYITMFSAMVLLVSFDLLYSFIADGEYEDDYLSLNLVFLFVLSLVFFISVGCFTAFSVYLVLRNTTTIEFQDSHWSGSDNMPYEYDNKGNRRKLGNFYDLGMAQNWRAVMGSHWYQWCFPVTVTSTAYDNFNNGLNFLVDEEVYQEHLSHAQMQQRLNMQLQQYRDRIRGVSNEADAPVQPHD